ncbi:hypothetical protein HPB49_017132 [Dermacentor silvarum]|uniref:Uncharacterized protein n=1 Tax=Dermacentor silvarum TaxID=543639 RepID=A0ACB8CYT0_DERSI|nr:hypothetical protein HPB49_017132 [Dermacentor silvarum]
MFQVLLEKLLRCCPVKRIYLLIRSKHGVEPDARLDAMLCSEIFQRIRQEVPDAFGKVKAVAGDLALPDLGLSETDMRTLVDEVSVVFHLASTVRPKETFKCTNEKATKLGKKFLIGQLNNCTLTNAVTESLLLDERGLLPVAIVRTSIVTASWKDPFPGWIDNCNSGTDLIVSLGLGLLPSVVLRNNCVADLIPVDVAADTLICVAWQIATTSSAARYDKAINAMEFVQFYTTNSWLFRSNNVVGLINDLSPTDKQLFNIDVRKLEWGQYWDQYIQGIRKFIFKTDDAELSTTRKHFGWLDAVRWFWYLALAVLAWRLALTPMAWNIYSSAGAFATGLGAIIGSPWSL